MSEETTQQPLKLKGRQKPAGDQQQPTGETETITQEDVGDAASLVGATGEVKTTEGEKAPVVETAPAAAPAAAPAPATQPEAPPPPQAVLAAAVPGYSAYVEQVAATQGQSAVDLVDVIVPKAFKVTLDNHLVIPFNAGVQAVHRFLADHGYSKANGMKMYVRPQGQVPGLTPAVYEDAIKRIRAGDIKVDYAITNIASFYKVPEEKVRAELDKLLAT